MRNRKTNTLFIALIVATFTLLSVSCTTTRTQNGVTIQESGGLNPFNYFDLF